MDIYLSKLKQRHTHVAKNIKKESLKDEGIIILFYKKVRRK